LIAASASVCALGAGACNKAPSDLREWRASDHDQPENPAQEGQVDGTNTLSSLGIDEVTLVAWRENCARCHGAMGAGDGPQGAMTHARDLSDGAWQAATSDESIARTIRDGRGMMPAFKLPDSTVSALVRLVRLFDVRRRNAPAEPRQ
jgi:mono/diheme cytochrome c family protein